LKKRWYNKKEGSLENHGWTRPRKIKRSETNTLKGEKITTNGGRRDISKREDRKRKCGLLAILKDDRANDIFKVRMKRKRLCKSEIFGL